MDCLVINGYVSDKIGLVFDRSHIAKMDDAAREDACREYQSSLEDLTFNSKPHINMLTILAEENLHFAKDIVAIIEAQITKAPAAEKLPVLYLVDSIVKNVGGEYLAVFAKNLVTSFICVFEKVDENTRKSLFKLRSTWDEIFPLKKLYALDLRVNSHDPAWPIKALPPTVNASIHVNPKFLKHPEEVTSPRALSPAPVVRAPAPAPQPAVVPSVSEKSITQEQVIRQQLLAKQKQLLELQQKKIELELEQTKAQLSCPSFPFQAANVVLSTPAIVPKATLPPSIKPCIPPVSDPKPPTRDPRLNRAGPGAPQAKESTSHKKESHGMGGPAHTPEKPLPERPGRPERTRPPKKELLDVKAKSKSLSPMTKGVLGKSKHHEAENVRTTADAPGKKDPRLRKHLHDKADPKEEVKEPKKCTDKEKETDEAVMKASARGKMANGSVSKPEREKPEPVEKPENQIRGNARTNARKRSRSPSLHPHSPKRKTERRSPKRRARSISPSPPLHKPGKGGRQSGGKHSSHHEDFPQHGTTREERVTPKKSLSEPRRTKRPAEERLVEARDTHSSPRTTSEGKETKENAKRWRSGWEENKHLKLSSEEAHGKGAGPPQRRPSYSSSKRPTTPKQHRLSVDANLQIPEVLHSASKRDLLKKASKHLENGEISHEDFLNVAHQIKQLFQYQEEKQRGGDSWEGSSEDGHGHTHPHHLPPTRKKPLLATPTGGVSSGADLSDAELTYYEHKSKLRRTQVMLWQQEQGGEGWDGEDSQEEGEGRTGEGSGGAKTEVNRETNALPSGMKFTRLPKDRLKEVEEEQPTPAAIIQEYSHGNEFPRLKSLPGLRFRRIQDPRESTATDRLKAGERERNSPLSERLPNHRPPYDEREEPKSGYNAPPRRYGGGPLSEDHSVKPLYPRYDDPRKHDRIPPKPPSGPVLQNSVSLALDGPIRKSPVPLPVPAYERERLSPLQQMDAAEMSPVPRFESPNSEHSCDEGPLDTPPLPRPHHPGGPLRGPALSSVRSKHSESPGHTPPHTADGPQRYDGGPKGGPPSPRYEGPHKGTQSGYDGPGHIGQPGRPHPGGRYEGVQGPGRYDGPGCSSHGPSRYDGPYPQGPGRFDGPPLHKGPEKFDGPGRYDGPSMPHVPMRGDPQGIGGRFDGGPPQQGRPSERFDGRFDGQGPGPMRFNGPMQSNRFDGPMNFNNSHMQPGPGRFEGLMRFQQGPMRFDGAPNQPGPMRFDGPVNPSTPMGQPGPMRYDPLPPQGMPPRFDCPSGQQVSPRYHATPNLQRPLGTPMYDPANPGGPQQFQTFPVQQNVVGQQGANFTVSPVPVSQAGFNNSYDRPPFYTPGVPLPPAGNMQQPMNMLPNLSQPFIPPSTVPFNQPAPQFPPPESHFGQVDVNDLLSKLISTGIISTGGIKPAQSTDTAAAPSGTESAATQPTPPVVEEEEEEEQEEDENVPDLTGFVIEDMKQRYDSVVTKLYTGIQCYSCGMRFTASQTDVYADHLDWHYRLNRSEKDISKKVTHRRWYYSLTDWIEFEEIADLEERAKSLFFEKVNEEVVQKTQEAAKEKEFQSVKAAADVVDETCEICQEQFEMYWEEEEEEWHLRDAIRVDEKTYHPSCFEDYNNTSSFLDVTPSPIKLMENPLGAFIKRENDEVTSCCAAVKQEVEASLSEAGGEAQNVKDEVQVKMEGETSAIS